MKNKGELVTPRDHPELASKVKEVLTHNHWQGQPLYLLENGTRYTEGELR